MRTRLAVLVASLLACPFLVSAEARHAPGGARPTNVYGAPTIGDHGERITYTRAEIDAQRSMAAPRVVSTPAGTTGVPAIWSYKIFGAGIGVSNILIGRSGGKREVYVGAAPEGFGPDQYWYALRRSSSGPDYQQTFVSEILPAPIVRMALGQLGLSASRQIVLALEDGEILVYDEESRLPLPGFSTVAEPKDMVLRDLDGDGNDELILTTDSALYVYSSDGTPLWNVPGVGGGVTVGQMDSDPALEIATTSGDVVDAATHAVQWHWPNGFGWIVRAADIDDDGRDELVAADPWNYVWAYDVERQLPKWSLTASDHDIGAIELVDVDCDGRPDLIVGENQWGSVKAFDTVSMALKWSIPNPEHGVTGIAIGDSDGDLLDNVLWGAGWTSTGPDHLYVVDLPTQSMQWSSLDLVGPLLGPAVGDIVGDGSEEIVAIASLSDAGYSGSRILVFDAKTRALRAISDPIDYGFYPTLDFKLRNVDADPALEIVMGSDYLYNGRVQVFDFDGASNAFTQIWSTPTPSDISPIESVEVADSDGDGGLDVIAGGSNSGGVVYVYDYATGALKWNTFILGGPVRDVAVESAGGGHPDLLAIRDDGELYAFDGVTHEALQITPGPFTAMRPSPDSGVRSVFVGDTSGSVYRYDRGPDKYELAATYPLGLGRIDGITFVSGGATLIGSDGKLSFYPSLIGAPAWTTADLGAPVGRYVCQGQGAHARFFTGTGLAVVEVSPGVVYGSFATGSGPASGGTTVVIGADGIQSGAGLFFGDDSATNVSVSVPTQIQGDTPPMEPGTLRPMLILNPDATFLAVPSPFFADFLDVPADDLFHDAIETMFRRAVTGGCGSGLFCGSQALTRAQMAVFLVRAGFGASFVAPKAQGRMFSDVACGDFGADEIEWIGRKGITVGCGGGAYCADNPVAREEMAVFLLKTLEGSDYVPPPAQGIFDDVPQDDPFAPWIEDLATRGITGGCGDTTYCPLQPVTREQMAAFVTRTFFVP
jgi:hypothetical protein